MLVYQRVTSMVFFPGAGGDDDGMLRLVELPHQFNGVGNRLHPAALVGMHQGAVQVEAETHGAGDLTADRCDR